MGSQVSIGLKRLSTLVTFERPSPCMNELMGGQSAAPGKSFTTLGTNKPSLVCVNITDMAAQMIWGCK